MKCQNHIQNFDTSSSYELSRALLNAARDILSLNGRSWDIAASLVEAIIRGEMRRDPGTSEHTQSLEFTENVLTVADRLLDNEFLDDDRLLALVSAISDYGHQLTQLHQSAKYLRPFWVLGENMCKSDALLHSACFTKLRLCRYRCRFQILLSIAWIRIQRPMVKAFF